METTLSVASSSLIGFRGFRGRRTQGGSEGISDHGDNKQGQIPDPQGGKLTLVTEETQLSFVVGGIWNTLFKCNFCLELGLKLKFRYFYSTVIFKRRKDITPW